MQDTVYHYLLRDIYGDLIQRLVDLYSEENIFLSQPCRDNTLYLLKLVDEMLISEIDHELLVCILLVFVFLVFLVFVSVNCNYFQHHGPESSTNFYLC